MTIRHSCMRNKIRDVIVERILDGTYPAGMRLKELVLAAEFDVSQTPLREALRELADRIGLDEAKALAVLFRQSEELGTSLTDALRVYSAEMRGQRILSAEERANALPVRAPTSEPSNSDA